MKKRNRIAAWLAALGVCTSMAAALPVYGAYGVGGTGYFGVTVRFSIEFSKRFLFSPSE